MGKYIKLMDKVEFKSVENINKYHEKIDVNSVTTLTGKTYFCLDNIDLNENMKILKFNQILIAEECDLYNDNINEKIDLITSSLVQIPLSSVDSIESHQILKHKIVEI